MGYRKIPNLYKSDASAAVLSMDRCYALEKIHGTSAHIAWDRKEGFTYFPGGIKLTTFKEMLDERFGLEALEAVIKNDLHRSVKSIVFYGEAYGGKCQKMSHIYGPLNFIVFEVKTNDEWCDVPTAYTWAHSVGLPFVHYEAGPATIEWLNSQRDLPSQQAKINGMGDDKVGEGIVIRSQSEDEKDRYGERIIVKHKRAEFRETKTPREIDPAQQKVWDDAKVVAEEFVVPMRLQHVLDKLDP
jgi:hypothetical protein